MKLIFVRLLYVTAVSVLPLFPAHAEKQGISREQAEALVAGLKFQQGEIALQDGLATLHMPEGLRFLNGSDARTVLVKLWGNAPHSAGPLGMLMPAEVSPLSETSWAVVMTYEPDGYVTDKDAKKINYTETVDANAEKRGLS